MSEMEKKQLVERTQGLSREEAEIICNNLPIDVVINRVTNELIEFLNLKSDLKELQKNYIK